jgi:hypothetical protein
VSEAGASYRKAGRGDGFFRLLSFGGETCAIGNALAAELPCQSPLQHVQTIAAVRECRDTPARRIRTYRVQPPNHLLGTDRCSSCPWRRTSKLSSSFAITSHFSGFIRGWVAGEVAAPAGTPSDRVFFSNSRKITGVSELSVCLRETRLCRYQFMHRHESGVKLSQFVRTVKEEGGGIA